jgi:hypothetical protein
MKIILVIASAVFPLLFSVMTHASVIDFDDLAHQTVVSNQYSGLGLTISAYENGVQVQAGPRALDQWSAGIDTINRQDNALYNCAGTTCSRPDYMRFDFSGTASGISWWQHNEGSLVPTWQAYGLGGALLGSYSFGSQNAWHYADISSLNNVSYLLAYQPSDSWTWAVDNFSFTLDDDQYQVAEPSNLALLGLGFLSLGLMRRFQRA